MKSEDQRLKKALLDEFNKGPEKLNVIDDPYYNNSAYVGLPTTRMIRKASPELADAMAEQVGLHYDKSKKALGTHSVILGKDPLLGSAGTLAHELGHAKYDSKIHQLPLHLANIPYAHMMDKPKLRKAAGAGAFGTGAYVSFKNQLDRLNGLNSDKDKKRRIKRTLAGLSPSLIYVPNAIIEGRASISGLNQLKRVGASKAYQRETAKMLGNAFGTYMSPLIAQTGYHLAGKAVGNIAARIAYKKYKDRNKKNKEMQS